MEIAPVSDTHERSIAPRAVPPPHARRGITVVVVALVLAALVGCGGDDGGTTAASPNDGDEASARSDEGEAASTSGDEGDAAGIPACPDVADVTATVGHDMAVSDEPVPAHWCAYVGGSVDVTYIYLGSMRSQIEDRLEAGFEPVPGVGEDATWNTEGDNQLAVRTGDDVGYVIEVFGTGDLDPRTLAIDLARIVIDG